MDAMPPLLLKKWTERQKNMKKKRSYHEMKQSDSENAMQTVPQQWQEMMRKQMDSQQKLLQSMMAMHSMPMYHSMQARDAFPMQSMAQMQNIARMQGMAPMQDMPALQTEASKQDSVASQDCPSAKKQKCVVQLCAVLSDVC